MDKSAYPYIFIAVIIGGLVALYVGGVAWSYNPLNYLFPRVTKPEARVYSINKPRMVL